MTRKVEVPHKGWCRDLKALGEAFDRDFCIRSGPMWNRRAFNEGIEQQLLISRPIPCMGME